MLSVTIRERGRVKEWRGAGERPPDTAKVVYLPPVLYDRLQRFEDCADGEVFRWHRGEGILQAYVGVIQLPGLTLEILPKIAEADDDYAPDNLRYMLEVAGALQPLPRGSADLATRKLPLHEYLIRLFADGLLRELLRGPAQAYMTRDENLGVLRGKLRMPAQVRQNAARPERLACRFDEFCADTPLNQAFKAACLRLLLVHTSAATQDHLRRCLAILDEVSPVGDPLLALERATITRQTERFRLSFNLCRLILSQRSPMPRSGAAPAFSLLFDMDDLFEHFIAKVFEREVIGKEGFEGLRLYPQAADHRRPLLQRTLLNETKDDLLRLKPDLLFVKSGKQLIIDTKWMRLRPGASLGVNDSAIYQIYAYTTRYACERSMLLFPAVLGVERREYSALGANGQETGKVGFEFVNLHANLRTSHAVLAGELRKLIAEFAA